MSRIRPTSSTHGVCEGNKPYVTISSEEACVRVAYAAHKELGTHKPVPAREFVLLTHRAEDARDVAKALRLLLAAQITSPINLPYVLKTIDFIESKP